MNKSFSEMTHSEIVSMSEEDYRKVSPFEKHSCYDCAHLKSALSWWCFNNEAAKYRGTRLPGVIKCHFWKPDWNYINEKYKTSENGYVSPKQYVKEKAKNIFSKIFNFNKK